MKKLLQLIKNNADRKPVAIRAEGDEATIYLYDVIDDYWGVSAAEINKALAELRGKAVTLRINSPGGDVFAGRAMATAIAQHGNVTAHIDGLAASAATYVAIAAKSVVIADGGFFMVHNAWTFAYGNKAELIETAGLLDKIDQSIVNDYARKTGKTVAEIVAWMNAETWFSAQEALENGFVDAIGEAAQASNAWNLSAYDKAPKALKDRVTPDPEPDFAVIQQRNLNRLRLYEIG